MVASRDYESDSAVAEIQDEMYRKEEERPKSGVGRLDQKTKFFIGLFIAAVLLLLFTNRISFQEGIIAALVGWVFLYFLKSDAGERQELTYIECMIRINDLLGFLQKHPIGDIPQIPRGKIHVKPIGRKQWYEGKSFKRSYAVDIIDSIRKVTEQYFVEVDVFTGDIITMRWSPEGVYGDETKDVKLLPSPEMRWARKRDTYLGKTQSEGK